MYDEFDLRAFNTLCEAFIDASSLIYMLKAGFLRQAQERLTLCTLPEIIDEAGILPVDLTVSVCPDKHVSNDRKLLCCALERRLPLISEDRKLLMQARRAGLPHYNSLMVLNFLLLKQIVNSEEYDGYLGSLRRYARYSDSVWSYGGKVRQRIEERLDSQKLTR